MKIKILTFSIILISFFFCPSALFSQEVSFPQNPLAGQKLFIEKGCVNCHSVMGQGGKIGSDLGKTQANRSPMGIVSMMWNHASDMTQVMEKTFETPKLTGEEMGNLIAFLYFISYFDELGEVDPGKKIFYEKGCIKCHSVGGEGGNIGPALDKTKQFASPILLAQAMWNHGSGMSATMEKLSISRPVFQGKDIANLLMYLRSISSTSVKEPMYMLPGNPQTGEKLFGSKGCINCHRIGRKGQVGPDLTRKEFHVGVTEIAAMMWNHGPKMWAKMKELNIERPKFQESEMADLIAYLYSLDFIGQSGNIENGKMVYTEKKCIECHSIQGKGGNVGPNLAQSKNVSNFIDCASAMWNHGFNMRLLMQKIKIPIPRFTENEMSDLLAYLRSQRLEK